MQQQTIQLCAQMKTIAEVNAVFKPASKLLCMTEELDPISAVIYQTVLDRRNALLNTREEGAPPPQSYYPMRKKSDQSRTEAASGARDPERWARKRRLGTREAMPASLCDQFTEGERAVLYIVASDIYEQGSCRCTNMEISDRAGVGLTTKRNALRKAKAYNLLNVQHRAQWRGKNLANIVTMVCKYWRAWLSKFRPKLGFNYHSKGVKIAKSQRPSVKQDITGSIFSIQRTSLRLALSSWNKAKSHF